VDAEAFLKEHVEDLNSSIKSRNFAGLIMKWFALPGSRLRFTHESHGLDEAVKMWTHLIPTGQTSEQGAPRMVQQVTYQIDDEAPGGRVYSFRELKGGQLPMSVFGLQETKFDHQTLISELLIKSAPDEPDVNADPGAPKSRLGRIFSEFEEVFNEYFQTGDAQLLVPWCSQELMMGIDDDLYGMGAMGAYVRIQDTTVYTLKEFDQPDDKTINARVDFEHWGGLDGRTDWKITLDDDDKIKEYLLELKI
jgi:hypothetical protein